MLFGSFVFCSASLAISILLLVALGARLRIASRLLGVLLAAGTYAAAAWVTARVWGIPASDLRASLVFSGLVAVVVIALRGVWNPVGQVFMATFVAAALGYLAFAAGITVNGHLSPIGAMASAILFDHDSNWPWSRLCTTNWYCDLD